MGISGVLKDWFEFDGLGLTRALIGLGTVGKREQGKGGEYEEGKKENERRERKKMECEDGIFFNLIAYMF